MREAIVQLVRDGEFEVVCVAGSSEDKAEQLERMVVLVDPEDLTDLSLTSTPSRTSED